MIKIIFSQENGDVLNHFKNLAQAELPEFFEKILFTSSSSKIPWEQKKDWQNNPPAFIGSIFYKKTTQDFYKEHFWTSQMDTKDFNLPRILFTPEKIGYKERRAFVQEHALHVPPFAIGKKSPSKITGGRKNEIVVIPQKDKNFVCMVKTILSGNANWYEELKSKFPCVEG